MATNGDDASPRPRRYQARQCLLCGRYRRPHEFVPAETVRPQVAAHIAEKFPDTWNGDGDGFLCRTCLNTERGDYAVSRLQQERDSLSAVEAEVARKAGESLIVAENPEEEFQRKTTFGQRAADATARVGGSWGFVLGFGLVAAGLDRDQHVAPSRAAPSIRTRTSC